MGHYLTCVTQGFSVWLNVMWTCSGAGLVSSVTSLVLCWSFGRVRMTDWTTPGLRVSCTTVAWTAWSSRTLQGGLD